MSSLASYVREDLALPSAPEWALDWDALQRYSWIQDLKDCPQDPVHHAEGNVWIHTRMVLESLIADPRWRAADPDRQVVLFAAATLHDIAKPATTVIEPDGRITARGHSARGAIMARGILWEMGMPFALREQTCGMIRAHQVPFYLIDRPDAQRLAAAISLNTRCDELSILADADIRGRICQDAQRILDNIALFRDYCAEQGCLDRPRSFPSAHSRVEYFHRPDRDIDYLAYDDTRVEVVVMSGMPGAGKDTWIRENLPDWPVVSLDALREEMDIDPSSNQGVVVQAARERAREFLRKQQPFVWNATNITRVMRSQTLKLLLDYHARIRIVYIEASRRALFEQNSNRQSVVPAAVLRKLIDKWEVPDRTEAHEVEYVIGD